MNFRLCNCKEMPEREISSEAGTVELEQRQGLGMEREEKERVSGEFRLREEGRKTRSKKEEK